MPLFHSSSDLDMHYEIDDFTDPWTTPETILMVHGNRESGAAWYGWVPTLARRYRVVPSGNPRPCRAIFRGRWIGDSYPSPSPTQRHARGRR
jgi:hypothetical protein